MKNIKIPWDHGRVNEPHRSHGPWDNEQECRPQVPVRWTLTPPLSVGNKNILAWAHKSSTELKAEFTKPHQGSWDVKCITHIVKVNLQLEANLQQFSIDLLEKNKTSRQILTREIANLESICRDHVSKTKRVSLIKDWRSVRSTLRQNNTKKCLGGLRAHLKIHLYAVNHLTHWKQEIREVIYSPNNIIVL